MPTKPSRASGIWALALLALCLRAEAARAEERNPYAPENLLKTYNKLSWVCVLPAACPVSSEVLGQIKGALAGERGAEYSLGLALDKGDGAPQDKAAALAWIVRAAEAGEPAAARELAGRQRNGAAIDADDTKIATVLKAQAESGDLESMRALGPMYIRGRGVDRDAAKGLDILKSAAAKGSIGAMDDLAFMYLIGAPGVPASRPESLKWYTAAASHGEIEAMVTLGGMWDTAPGSMTSSVRDAAQAFCWLMRASLLDWARAQEPLALMYARGNKDEHGTQIARDPVQADFWFRLAARSPFHDVPGFRIEIERDMTTSQLNAAKELAANWHPLSFQELKTKTIALPPNVANGASPGTCPQMNSN
jgi:TPR repeat protein